MKHWPCKAPRCGHEWDGGRETCDWCGFPVNHWKTSPHTFETTRMTGPAWNTHVEDRYAYTKKGRDMNTSIYVASSWRNERQQEIVKALSDAGFIVYDFKHPAPDNEGFHWSDIDPHWQTWTPEQFIEYLDHPIAENGFQTDWQAMIHSDACVLVMPCGRSAHLEAGYFKGAGKRLVILLSDGEPELMYAMAYAVCTTIEGVIEALRE